MERFIITTLISCSITFDIYLIIHSWKFNIRFSDALPMFLKFLTDTGAVSVGCRILRGIEPQGYLMLLVFVLINIASALNGYMYLDTMKNFSIKNYISQVDFVILFGENSIAKEDLDEEIRELSRRQAELTPSKFSLYRKFILSEPDVNDIILKRLARILKEDEWSYLD